MLRTIAWTQSIPGSRALRTAGDGTFAGLPRLAAWGAKWWMVWVSGGKRKVPGCGFPVWCDLSEMLCFFKICVFL